MTDRRRVNGPAGNTSTPVFAPSSLTSQPQPQRLRKPNELRKIFLQTGFIPSASGSAYLELESPPTSTPNKSPASSTIKLSCAVHGPKPLPRTASFSPNLQLSASVKFSPFATRIRQGYVRDSTEKDLGMHLENALKGAIIPERWPKSGIDVSVTVLEAEQDQGVGDRITGVALFNVLAGCINVAMAAIADSKIDCLDLLAAGVGATVPGPKLTPVRVLDPAAAEHEELLSMCLVGLLPSRDEIVEIWSTGSIDPQGSEGVPGLDELVDSAVAAARGAQTVLKEVLLETLTREYTANKKQLGSEMNDVEMNT